ncbi:MAG: ATP-dependent DNA ligase [archaeon]
MEFSKLAQIYEELENTPSGNKMREILAEFFKKVPKEDLSIVSYLTLGQIASDYDNVVLGLADKTALKAIITASGQDSSKVKKILQETGDLGLTAEKVCGKTTMTLIPKSKLSIKEVFDKLHKIAEASGSGSQELRTGLLASLLQKASPTEAKYIMRISVGTLRMGVGDMTVLDALAIAFTGEKKNKEFLEKAYNICPDLAIISETLVKKGIKGIENIDIHVGRPIKMMLAQRVKELDEVPKKIPSKLAIEGKFDGERVQAHKDEKGKIHLFSRRLDDITAQFPDLAKALEEKVKAKTFVIEGEILAVDKDGNPKPFQTLMQRKRKYDIADYVKKVPIVLKAFDLLYLNGKSYLHEPYHKRTKELENIIPNKGLLLVANKIYTEDLDEINKFFHKMLKEGFEGIIIKGMDSEYQAGTRGWSWIKWKKDYVKEMVDTFDFVIVGAFYGKGKRSGTYGALLCASYNDKDDTFETVCKLGTGLTDELLAELPKKLKKYEVDKQPARLEIKKELKPDIWFEPKLVVEVSGAEITKSPTHTCASGLALRFPRFIRYRDNKKAEQATTSKEVEEIYSA